jgi:hypothetical protein
VKGVVDLEVILGMLVYVVFASERWLSKAFCRVLRSPVGKFKF